MKIKSLTVILLLLIGYQQSIVAGEHPRNINGMFSVALNDTVMTPTPSVLQGKESELLSRRTTAIIYSCVVPGAGQTMLGNNYKGIGFTLLAFGSALTAGISHNNFIARNERLDAMEFAYLNSSSWENADLIYNEMRNAHSQLQKDQNRRNIFLIISAVVWVSNILDVMYFTEDQGQSMFSAIPTERPLLLGSIDSPHKPLLSYSLPLQ